MVEQNTEDFILVGKINAPIQAHILHMVKFNAVSLYSYLNKLSNNEIESKNLVLMADSHLSSDSFSNEMAMLKRAVNMAGFQISGVMGSEASNWAKHLDCVVINENEVIQEMNTEALNKRMEFLRSIGGVNEVSEIVENSLNKVKAKEESVKLPETVISKPKARKRAKSVSKTGVSKSNKSGKNSTKASNSGTTKKTTNSKKTQKSSNQQDLNTWSSDMQEPQAVSKEVSKVVSNSSSDSSNSNEMLSTSQYKPLASEAQVKQTKKKNDANLRMKPKRLSGRVRSGQVIEYNGDIIVEGSVHNGSELIASGDIHVYGTAGGRLMAGSNGDEEACIYVQNFNAEMISIAGHYHMFEEIAAHWVGRPLKISFKNGKLFFESMETLVKLAA